MNLAMDCSIKPLFITESMNSPSKKPFQFLELLLFESKDFTS